MILLLHVFIALSSIAYSTYAFFAPTARKLHVSYGLVAATLASGTWLVVSTHASLVQSCISGLVYLATLSVVLVAARYKLAKQ